MNRDNLIWGAILIVLSAFMLYLIYGVGKAAADSERYLAPALDGHGFLWVEKRELPVDPVERTKLWARCVKEDGRLYIGIGEQVVFFYCAPLTPKPIKPKSRIKTASYV